jgi:hypothetical protein
MLTDLEKEEIANLRPGFNVVKESNDPTLLSARRIEVSKVWSRRLLRFAFWCNIVTLLCFVMSIVMVVIKPDPDFYASTPSGKIYGPLKKLHP